MFQLTKEAFENWKSQIVTSKIYSEEEINALKMGARRTHDRYLIVDDEVCLLGASAKDMGHGLCTVIKVGFRPEMLLELLK